jgi:hypothetical protein
VCTNAANSLTSCEHYHDCGGDVHGDGELFWRRVHGEHDHSGNALNLNVHDHYFGDTVVFMIMVNMFACVMGTFLTVSMLMIVEGMIIGAVGSINIPVIMFMVMVRLLMDMVGMFLIMVIMLLIKEGTIIICDIVLRCMVIEGMLLLRVRTGLTHIIHTTMFMIMVSTLMIVVGIFLIMVIMLKIAAGVCIHEVARSLCWRSPSW